MPLSSGTKIGVYEVNSLLGVGGMGEVYRSRDSKLSRQVALKVLPSGVAADTERLTRFRREATLLAALNHPNIAAIYGFEDSGATHALVMELVEGPTLADRIKSGRISIEETLPIEKELYLGILVDRAEGKPVFMASAAGGMEIEQVAAENPDAILKQHLDPGMGLEAFQARKMAFKLGLNAKQITPAVQFLSNLYKAFLDTDASLLEINPFITTTDGRLFALDAKLTFDDNALFRHPDIRELRDITEEDPLEVEASKYSLNYIKLEGSVGCMVNGAGLAMATMDIIKYAGGMPANFLDVGGGANAEQVAHAFEILLSDKSVKAVLINIFGGILRVDTLATGVVEAAKKTNIQLPVVLRLEGTNVDEGKKILMNSGFNFIVADTMKDAADRVVAAARG